MPVNDMPCDGQAEARPGAASTRLVGLVEALEDAHLVCLRDADPVVLDRHDDLLRSRPNPDRHVAAVRAELDRIVQEVDQHLPEPILRSGHGGNLLRDLRPQDDALAFGEQPQPLYGGDRQSPEVDRIEQRHRTTGLDPGEVEQLVDHLDQVVRLDLDLGDPVAHPGRQRLAGLVRLADERLGQQADGGQRGPQLVRQVVDELRPDSLQAAQLGDVLHDQPDAADRGAAGPDNERRAIRVAQRAFAVGCARLARRLGDPFDRRVDERLDRRSANQAAGGPTEERMRGGIGGVHHERIVEAHDAHPDDLQQPGAIPDDLAQLPLGCPGAIERRTDLLLRIDGIDGRTAGLGHQFAQPPQGATPGQSHRQRHAEKQRLDYDEADHHGIHARSIAHRRCPAAPMCNECPERTPARSTRRLGLRLRMIPREERFYDLFVEDAANVLGAARLLEAMLRSYDDIDRRNAELRDAEHRGDEISHDIGHRLEGTFVTPFDREDIHSLISGLDDVIDMIEEIGDTFGLYRIEAPTAIAVQQAAIIVKQCELLHEALLHLRGMKHLDTYWIEVHRLENEGDQLVRSAIADLFEGNPDPIHVFKWKEIYNLLETAIDRCEDVANIIERIVVKHA